MKHPKSTLPPKGRGEILPSARRINSISLFIRSFWTALIQLCSNPHGIGEFFDVKHPWSENSVFAKDRLSTATCTKDRIACHRINCKQTEEWYSWCVNFAFQSWCHWCFHPVRKKCRLNMSISHTCASNLKNKSDSIYSNLSSKVYYKNIPKTDTYEPSSGIICKAKVQVLKPARLPRPFIALLKLRRSALRRDRRFPPGFPESNETNKTHRLHPKKNIKKCEW